MAPAVALHPDMQVPHRDIPRLRYPEDLTPERFEREFAGRSEPCIIEGLIDDWPAFRDTGRNWHGERWDEFLGGDDDILDVGFDPVDSRMMHFGDDEGDSTVLFNPGRLRIPAWAFLEVARLRQEIIAIRSVKGRVDLQEHPSLQARLDREVSVQNLPFLAIDAGSPLQFFAPQHCRIRDLVPLSFYLSHDTYSLPPELQSDLSPQASKLIPGWGSPNSSRIWATNGPPWRTPYPAWSSTSAPEPCDDKMIYSCFHCDRMENFHSLIAGEKQVVLVPPGKRDVLNATRYAVQKQWLLAPITSSRPHEKYMSSTLFTSKQTECTSDQSAVHPLRSPAVNRSVSKGQWPDAVDFPVCVGRLRKGDTLFIPAYHWHWVATSTPPALGVQNEGALALSVNFWWWPIHNDRAMEQWSFQNECESWQNARIPIPRDKLPPDYSAHANSFYRLTTSQRQEAAKRKPWPCCKDAASGKSAPERRIHGAPADLVYELVD